MKNTQNKKRKGFTIVELVIVIAVIAILAAVMIPTFGSIIETANRSADTQLVAQINTILFVEDTLGGGVNDAVEIQKIVEANGLKLETKSKGLYIWYDIDAKKVVLAGLNESGIAIDGANDNGSLAYIDANRPVLLDGGESEPEITEVPKGNYKSPTSPESFVEGYLFLSKKSADKLADAIHALRNPEGDTQSEVTTSLTDALADLAKIAEDGKVAGAATVSELMQDFMSRTAILTKYGTIFVGTNAASVTKILVSSGTDTLTSAALSGLATTYPQLYVVDLHSDVIDIEDVSKVIEAGQIDAETRKVNGIYFVYCNEEIKAIDKDPAYNGNVENLITVDERSQYITQLIVVRVYLDKNGNPVVDENGNRVQDSTGLGYEYPTESHKVVYDFRHLTHNTADKAYEFKTYSFDISGNPGIAVGTENRFLTEDEQLKINGGVLTLYAIFNEVNADFKIGDKCYSSAQVTSMLADPSVSSSTIGGNTITVISTTATLGSATETNLKIPSGVELLLPFKGDVKQELTLANGGDTLVEMDFAKTGATQLTIESGVTLVNEGSIYVDAQLYYHSTPVQSNTKIGTCGVLILNDGSTIESKGSITVLGVVRGEGSINAVAGYISDLMTIYDWYGGTNAAYSVGASYDGTELIEGKGVVPFNNWKMEHIRVDVTIGYNSQYKAICKINIGSGASADFALVASSNALFVMKAGADGKPNGEIVKTMSSDGDNKFVISKGVVEDVPTILTIEDVINYDVPCVGKVNLDASINFTEIPLPLSHFDVDVASGAQLIISGNYYKVLPGSIITVEKGATLDIGTKVVICNTFERVNATDAAVGVKQGQYPVTDEPSTIVVNGTLNFNSGASFAGKITTTDKNSAVIKANVTVGGATFPDGSHISGDWYDYTINGLYEKAVLVGTIESEIAEGTYTYQEVTENDVTISGWFIQQ